MNDLVTQAMLLTGVRAALYIVGAFAAALGHKWEGPTEQVITEIAGALSVLCALAWSAWDRISTERATKAREAIAVNKGIAIADATVGATPAIPAVAVPAVLAAVPTPVPVPMPQPGPADIAAIVKAATVPITEEPKKTRF